MNQIPRHAAFIAGLAVVAWVGAGYVLTNPLALAITVLIGALYVAGVLELRRFRGATDALAQAVAELPETLDSPRAFLARVPASLVNSVRRRIEGEPVGLPGPALAPTLAGLLVLLGMLGTFLGMILTLRGTGAALETATDLVAVRNSLIAPVKGLGLAFGTSVAGVATSAALGLLSALARRERLAVAQGLDARIATTLRPFSMAHQREASLVLLQRQADLMPALVDALKSLMDTLATQSAASGERLLASQERFQRQAEAAYAGLAASVDRTLQASLTEGARIAGDTIRPVAEATLAGIARETGALHAALAGTMQGQLDQLSTRFEPSTATVAGSWQALLARDARAGDELAATLSASHERFAQTFDARSAALLDASGAQAATAAATFERHSASLLGTVQQAHAELQSTSAARDQQRVDAMARSLEAMAESVRQQWQQAGAQSLEQQQRVVETMERTARDITVQAETQARATIAEIGRLVQAASEAPRAAAEVISELRQKLSDSMARDNTMLDERARILDTLGTLLDGVNQAASEQRGAIDALVTSSAEVLERVGARSNDQVQADAGKLADVAAQVGGGAAHGGSLGG
ncbi:MAG: DUF802 domain-containing protein, partial [Caulobacter sp.]|nr:DUF802 domain-containing protein [Vitreoscilla sp.]